MATLPKNPRVRTRTSRQAYDTSGTYYVLMAGAPPHYIPGYGLVHAGSVITLPEHTQPGVWLEPVNPKDVAKVSNDESLAGELAQAARQRAEDRAAEQGVPFQLMQARGGGAHSMNDMAALVTKGAGVPVSDDAAAVSTEDAKTAEKAETPAKAETKPAK